MIYSVAIDGPGGAGKSTVARRVAQKRGIVYVDTGAMYRAVALYMLTECVDVKDEDAVKKLLPGVDIQIKYSNGEQRIFLCGRDVSEEIRRPDVSMAASTVSAYKSVREYLLEAQRDIARTHSVIMDGRDIGTVVLPDALVKIFLTGDVNVRAQRRCKELRARGEDVDFETVLSDIKQRDLQDSQRANSPLKPAPDSVTVDTTDMDFDRVVNLVMDITDKKTGE